MTILSRPGTRRYRPYQPVTSSPQSQNNPGPTFGEFLKEFRQDYGGWSESTWRGLSGVLRNLEVEFGEYQWQITPRQIDAYPNRRRRAGVSDATSNRYLAALKTLYKTARIWGHVEVAPTDQLQMLKEQSRIPSALTDEDLERLLRHCPEPIRTIIAIGADTGLRSSELRRLTWQDVDVDAGTHTVRKTKNGQFRVIPMTQRVVDLLTTAGDTHLPVLPQGDFSRALAKAAAEAGVGHVHPHMLRHTFATRLRDRGVPLDRIMELMGHRSYQMALRYAKARPQQLNRSS